MNYKIIVYLLHFFINKNLLSLAQILCQNNGNYTSTSTYGASLNTTLDSLYDAVDNNGFYTLYVNQDKNRVYGFVLCRGDAQLSACRQCIKTGSDELLRSCPNQKQAILWGELCVLRYSNESIYGTLMTRPAYYWSNTGNATSPERFQEDVRTLLDDLRNQAASAYSQRKVAAGNISGPDFQTIFALVQCTPDLSREDCSSCLYGAATEIPQYCDRKRGCRVLYPSCNLHFETYQFYNETRLQEFGSDPVPAPLPVVDSPLQSSPGKDDGNTDTGRKKDDNTVKLVVPIVVCTIILAVFASILWSKRMKRRRQELLWSELTTDEINTEKSLQYDFGKIRAATSDFADANKLGEGGFGAVYQGKNLNGQEIAVKRLAKNSGQGDIEFKNEVLLVAKLQHRNLVKLLGFAMERMERVLIYEFVQNASLDQFIFDPIKRSYLDWDKRYKIILGIARGLMYLHEDSRLKIVHRDLKASNVLLDGDMNPKIADFGMARLFEQDETQRSTNRIVGTYGYMAPEYAMYGDFSIKSDVFSFGVLVLEIISGQRNNYTRNMEYLLTSTWKKWLQGTLENTIDPVLLSNGRGSMREMLRCIHIGLLCVQENGADRPATTSIVSMLNTPTMTLAVPSEPAFYIGSHVAQFQEHDIQVSNSSKASNANAIISEGLSQNGLSVTELCPR